MSPVLKPLRMQRQNNLVNLGQPSLPLLHDLRLERALPIAGNLNRDITDRIRHHRLRPGAITHIRRLTAWFGVVLLVTEMLGHLLIQAVSRTFLVNSFNNPSGPVSSNPRRWASATIAAAAACSGDSFRPSEPGFFHGLTIPEVITHSAHAAGLKSANQTKNTNAETFRSGGAGEMVLRGRVGWVDRLGSLFRRIWPLGSR